MHTVSLLTAAGELLPVENMEAQSLAKEDEDFAFQKGEERGEKKGYAKALAETKVFLGLLQTVSKKLLEHKSRLLDQLKPEIIEFALAVSEKVIRKELSDPQVFIHLIKSLLDHAAPHLHSGTLHILLSPDDYQRLEKSFSLIQYDKWELEGLRFFSDSLIRPGDCRIEAKSGLLNYDIARELKELQANVLQR